MPHYGIKLLFQYRVAINGRSGKRRTCEERTLNLQARSAREALGKAKKRGKAAEFKHPNSERGTIFFEFVGIVDLLKLGAETDPDEVWYEIHDRLEPMERRNRIVPNDRSLLALAE
ncbi:MAG: DUF4288 domain-containing protein [Planctomycetes bacterium]|nr:DUF4288 domain-containing protein [Planctomycetota bacterium]